MGAGRLGAARVGSLLGWCASAPVPEGLAFSGSPVNAPYFFPFPPLFPLHPAPSSQLLQCGGCGYLADCKCGPCGGEHSCPFSF